MTRKTRLLALLLLLALCLGSCANRSDMPLGGTITFHGVRIDLPDGYIRDSTQSTEDFWLYEKGFFRQYVMLMRKPLSGSAEATLDSYSAYLLSQGASSERTTFLGCEAVRSFRQEESGLWQEVLIAYEGATIAIALRGGTEADFAQILDGVSLVGVQ